MEKKEYVSLLEQSVATESVHKKVGDITSWRGKGDLSTTMDNDLNELVDKLTKPESKDSEKGKEKESGETAKEAGVTGIKENAEEIEDLEVEGVSPLSMLEGEIIEEAEESLSNELIEEIEEQVSLNDDEKSVISRVINEMDSLDISNEYVPEEDSLMDLELDNSIEEPIDSLTDFESEIENNEEFELSDLD